MQNKFYRTLSICGTNFIACWAYSEAISSHAEYARKCLKVEYLGRIEYDFRKSRVTGPWDHMVLVSAKKVKKNSCLCTFNRRGGGQGPMSGEGPLIPLPCSQRIHTSYCLSAVSAEISLSSKFTRCEWRVFQSWNWSVICLFSVLPGCYFRLYMGSSLLPY